MKNKHPERQPQKAISSGCSFQRYFFSSLLLVIHKRLVLTPASWHLLGHSSLETTRIYLLTSGKEHQRQMERLGLITWGQNLYSVLYDPWLSVQIKLNVRFDSQKYALLHSVDMPETNGKHGKITADRQKNMMKQPQKRFWGIFVPYGKDYCWFMKRTVLYFKIV